MDINLTFKVDEQRKAYRGEVEALMDNRLSQFSALILATN